MFNGSHFDPKRPHFAASRNTLRIFDSAFDVLIPAIPCPILVKTLFL
jgi:hypothetical protein